MMETKQRIQKVEKIWVLCKGERQNDQNKTVECTVEAAFE